MATLFLVIMPVGKPVFKIKNFKLFLNSIQNLHLKNDLEFGILIGYCYYYNILIIIEIMYL